MFRQRQDILAALAERQEVDRVGVEPIEQVAAEAARLRRVLQGGVRGGDRADLNGDLFGAAHPPQGPRLQHAEDLGLGGQRQVARLVQKDRAAVGQLETCRRRSSVAPVKAPLTWPNNSLSSSVSAKAGQLTATNGSSGAAA